MDLAEGSVLRFLEKEKKKTECRGGPAKERVPLALTGRARCPDTSAIHVRAARAVTKFHQAT